MDPVTMNLKDFSGDNRKKSSVRKQMIQVHI